MEKNMKHIIKKYLRYAWYGFRVFVLEKPRGLDFHMRDTHLLRETGCKYHGYAVTPESHLRQIFKVLNVAREHNFIDIGCGKGLVLTKAAKEPYLKVTGIDIDVHLIEIAQENLKILKLQERVNVQAVNAMEFNYEDYDHFFFFNPFSTEILKKVIQRILDSLKNRYRELTVIYVNPTCHTILMETGCFKVVHKLYCFMKDYETYIYQSV
jgi:16S rRNA G966 N2-methylase RsmD